MGGAPKSCSYSFDKAPIGTWYHLPRFGHWSNGAPPGTEAIHRERRGRAAHWTRATWSQEVIWRGSRPYTGWWASSGRTMADGFRCFKMATPNVAPHLTGSNGIFHGLPFSIAVQQAVGFNPAGRDAGCSKWSKWRRSDGHGSHGLFEWLGGVVWCGWGEPLVANDIYCFHAFQAHGVSDCGVYSREGDDYSCLGKKMRRRIESHGVMDDPSWSRMQLHQDVLNTPFAKLLKLPPPHVLNWVEGENGSVVFRNPIVWSKYWTVWGLINFMLVLFGAVSGFNNIQQQVGQWPRLNILVLCRSVTAASQVTASFSWLGRVRWASEETGGVFDVQLQIAGPCWKAAVVELCKRYIYLAHIVL